MMAFRLQFTLSLLYRIFLYLKGKRKKKKKKVARLSIIYKNSNRTLFSLISNTIPAVIEVDWV